MTATKLVTRPRRRTAAAAAPERDRKQTTAVATAAYVYVLDRSPGNGTWHTIDRARIAAPSAQAAAERIADLMDIDAAAAPTVLRVRVWTWLGNGVPHGPILDVLLTTEPDAVRQTSARRGNR